MQICGKWSMISAWIYKSFPVYFMHCNLPQPAPTPKLREKKKEKNKSNDSLLYKASLCIFETFFLNCFVQPKIGSRGNNRFAWMSSHNFILHLMTRIMEIIWSGWLYIEVWLAPGHSKYFQLFVCWFVVRGDQCWVTISCSLASTWSSPTTGQDIWGGGGRGGGWWI